MHTLTLSEPISFKKVTISELVFKPLKVKHMEAMDAASGETGKAIALIASCTGVASDAIREMCADDFLKAQEIVMQLLKKSQATGDE